MIKQILANKAETIVAQAKTVTESEIEKIKEKLQKMLAPNRYLHSLGTADAARQLARQWRLDEGQAYLAGLLHDFAKYYSKERLLTLAREGGLAIDEWTARHPGILHGPVAALRLRAEWGIDDAEIAAAIASHTLPQAEMGDLAKIVYLADKIEPGRQTWPGLARLRQLAYSDLDAAILATLDEVADYVAGKGREIYPGTEEIRRKYRNKIT